jgi:hypothetical protein
LCPTDLCVLWASRPFELIVWQHFCTDICDRQFEIDLKGDKNHEAIVVIRRLCGGAGVDVPDMFLGSIDIIEFIKVHHIYAD